MVLIKTSKGFTALNPALFLSVSLLTDYSDTPNNCIRIESASSYVALITARGVDLCLVDRSPYSERLELPSEGKDLNGVFFDLTGHTTI